MGVLNNAKHIYYYIISNECICIRGMFNILLLKKEKTQKND